jgi:ketosteroid isomerase-like protein/mono/diheme cytochrome c family protein
MSIVTRNLLLTLALLAIVAILLVGGFVWSGIYYVGADAAHTRPVHALLETTRQRSIARRAASAEVPDLSDVALIREGAGNYDSMCSGCHLAPGIEETELSKGLYPAPPAFAQVAAGDPTRQFWVIKHGLKGTGMPAWGRSMEDRYIWGMVAMLQELPELDATRYQALVASSGGHSHGGGETEPHEHAGTAPDEHGHSGEAHAGEAAGHSHEHEPEEGVMHTHADGPRERHPAPNTAAAPAVAVVEQFSSALKAGDLKRAGRFLADDVVILESGGAERSRAEYLGGHAEHDAAFLKGAEIHVTRRTARAEGPLAWVATESELHATDNGKTLTLLSTETMLLKKTGDGWRIVHIHWSSRPKG